MKGLREFLVFILITLFGLDFGLAFGNEWLPEDFATKSVRAFEAQKLFFLIEQKSSANFERIENGCFERELEMSSLILQEGYEPLRIWVFGDLQVKNKDLVIKWTKHIAPALFVQNEEEVQIKVFDPGLAHEPIEIGLWINLFSDGCKDITKEFYFSSTTTQLDEQFGCYYIIEKRRLTDLRELKSSRKKISRAK